MELENIILFKATSCYYSCFALMVKFKVNFATVKFVSQGSEFSMEKLRKYQLNRLKYYYAIMECNSAGMGK